MKPMKTITNEEHKVEIYENCKDTLRVYKKFAVLTIEGTKWVGNSGGYHEYKHRIDGADFDALATLLRLQAADASAVEDSEIVDAAVVTVSDGSGYRDFFNNDLRGLELKIRRIVGYERE